MSYFSSFPKILGTFNIDGKIQEIVLTDITTNVRFLSKALNSIRLYDNYIIKDGETPDIISAKFYGTSDYHWILMLANDKINYLEDFPKSQYTLDKYITEKYGINADVVSFYVANGKIVDYGTVGANAITNRVYENLVNESKRTLKIISKDLIDVVLKDFIRLING